MPTPRPASVRLTRWGEARRLGTAALLGLIVWFAQFEVAPPRYVLLPLLDLVVGAGAIVLLHQRRRWPLLVAVVITLASAISALAAVASLIALISLVTTRGLRYAAPVVGLGIVTVFPSEWLRPSAPADQSAWWESLGTAAGVYGATLLIGLLIRARRELAQTRAEAAERAEADRLAAARLNERSRIAREMHDVLAHRISLVAMHAGAMTYRTDLTRDQLAGSAQVVQENAHQALVELREVLGVLREPGPDGPQPPSPPQPTLADLPRLIDEARAAGTTVRLDSGGTELARVPDTVGRTAYRIIQEALTNARKHAQGAPVDVRLSGAPGDRLVIEISNPLVVSTSARPVLPGAGVGLIGLGERVDLAGGELDFGESAGIFGVQGWLPWPA